VLTLRQAQPHQHGRADLVPDAGRVPVRGAVSAVLGVGDAAGRRRAVSQPRLTRQMIHKPTESQLQDQIVDGLRRCGWTVLEVGRWRRRVQCPCGCGHWFTPRGGSTTPGAPDLLVCRPGDGHTHWRAIELKTPPVRTLAGTLPGGRLRKEQRALAELGLIAVVRTWEEAQVAVEAQT
jgi:hypothetical protein